MKMGSNRIKGKLKCFGKESYDQEEKSRGVM